MAQENIDNRLKLVEEALDKFEKDNGIPLNNSPGPESELEEYLNMDRNDIERLSGTDCAAIAMRLGQFSIYVQRLINRDTAKITWAKQLIAECIAGDPNYDKFRKYELAVELLAKESTAVKRLATIIRYSQQRIDRLAFVATGLKNLSDIMITNQRAKRAEREDE